MSEYSQEKGFSDNLEVLNQTKNGKLQLLKESVEHFLNLAKEVGSRIEEEYGKAKKILESQVRVS